MQTDVWGAWCGRGGDGGGGGGGGAHAAAGLPAGAATAEFSRDDFLRALLHPPAAVYVCAGADGVLRAVGGVAGVGGAGGARLAAAARLAPSGPQRTAVLEASGGARGEWGLRVRVVGGLAPHAELLLWPADALALAAHVPALTPAHIKGAGRYECACGARFAEPNHLKVHLYAGGGAGAGGFWRRLLGALRPAPAPAPAPAAPAGHPCPYCGRLYSRRYGLRIHVRTHTGARPLRCPERACARRFADPSNLNKHRRTHRRERGLQ